MTNHRIPIITEEDAWDIKSFTSEENDQNDPKAISYDLCKFMRPPIPLIQKGKYGNNEVKTAYKLNFIKLPNFVSENGNVDEVKKYEKPNREDDLANNNNKKNPCSTTLDTKQQSASNLKTLYALYPDGDLRQVYKKYKHEKTILDIEDRVYASIFIDLNKLFKSGKITKLQYENSVTNLNDGVKNIESETLIFSSNFESGNLFTAFKISNNEYDLILQNDINSKGHTQWFFFSVSNTIKDSIIKFNIVNMMKPDSLFNNGMMPVVLSTLENKQNGTGWQRQGTNISYYKNSIAREFIAKNTNQGTYYTLTFTYKFNHHKDTVYFAHSFPYTYSDLNNYLNKFCSDNTIRNLISRKILCKTLAHNDCEYLTITSNKNTENVDRRYGIFFSARQHPGESLSSYMMQGIIDFLIGNNDETDFLRQHCVFKIIPMLNPDGVIHGNYRTSLSGADLNRRWKKTSKLLHPTIYNSKVLIRKLKQEHDIQLVLDLHGHSRKLNTFIYGCNDPANPLSSRVFPYLLSKLSPTFSFEDSRFVVQKSKESTARISLWKELKFPNVFTLEASFYGYETNGNFYHYTKQDYLNIGRDICKALYIYLTQFVMGVANILQEPRSQPNQKSPTKESKLVTTNPNAKNSIIWLEELKTNKELIELGDKPDDSGSDANPSEDDLPLEEISKLCPKISPKKKDKESRMNSTNKKAEKGNTSTNNIIEDFKKGKPSTLEKSPSKRKLSFNELISQPIIDTNFEFLNMINRETQTDEIIHDFQDFNLTDTQNYNYVPFGNSDPFSEFQMNIQAERIDEKNIGIQFTNELLTTLIPQFQYYKVYSAEKPTDNLANNFKTILLKQSPPMMRDIKKSNIINEASSKGPSTISTIHTKNKIRINFNNRSLWIKGKKYEDISKDMKAENETAELINLNQTVKDERKNESISELSSIIYKNMTSPISKISKNPQTKLSNPRPITASERKILYDLNSRGYYNFAEDKEISHLQTSQPYFQRYSNHSFTFTKNTRYSTAQIDRNISFRQKIRSCSRSKCPKII